MVEKCYICEKGSLKKKKVPYTLHGVLVGNYNATVCSSCGEVFFDEKECDKMTERTKELGLWGLNSKTTIGRSGSTLDIRLSKKIIEFFDLKKGKEIDIFVKDKHTMEIKV